MKMSMLLAAAIALSGISASAQAAERCRDVRGRYIVCRHVSPMRIEKCRDKRGRFMKCTIRHVR